MESYAAVYHRVVVVAVHGVVHLFVHQAESYRLVAHHGLVVRFGVRYGLHPRQTVGERMPHLPYVPLLVGDVFELFYPIVGGSHSQAVVEAYASVRCGNGHARHAADILGYRYGRGVQLVYQRVG